MKVLGSSDMVSGHYGSQGGKKITRTRRNITLFVLDLSCSYTFQNKHRVFPKQNETFGLFKGVTMRQFF